MTNYPTNPPRGPLVRPKNGRMISGVCLALARYFNVDVAIIRLLTLLFGLVSGGTAAIAYLIAIVLIPEQGNSGPRDTFRSN